VGRNPAHGPNLEKRGSREAYVTDVWRPAPHIADAKPGPEPGTEVSTFSLSEPHLASEKAWKATPTDPVKRDS